MQQALKNVFATCRWIASCCDCNDAETLLKEYVSEIILPLRDVLIIDSLVI